MLFFFLTLISLKKEIIPLCHITCKHLLQFDVFSFCFLCPSLFFFFIMWFIFLFYDFWILIHIEKLSYSVVVVFLFFWTSFNVCFKYSYSLIFVLILWPIWNSSHVGCGIRLQFFVCPPHGCSVVPQHTLNSLFLSTHFRCCLYQILVLLCI